MFILEKIIKNKKFFLISIILIITIFISILSIRGIAIRNSNNKMQEEKLSDFSYEIKMFTLNDDFSYTFLTLVTIQEMEGIEQIKYMNAKDEEVVLNCNGKSKVAVDIKALENKEYDFKITPLGKNEKTEKLVVKRKLSGENTYKLVKGVYLNTPFLENFNNKYTRYMTLTANNVLTPAGWINNSEPADWYDYKNQNWANVYVETEGVEASYVWIPRYVYKLSADNQRSDIKFVDVNNNYINADTDEHLSYSQLLEQGYRLPEAFEFSDNSIGVTSISGYWISKYQLSDFEDYKLNYNMTTTKTGITVNKFTNNVSTTATKYTYAINGEIKNPSETLNDYIFTGLNTGETYTVNVTALNDNDEIVASMTKTISPTEVNPPDLEGFDPDTTFYVYYDEDGTEHNEIPISKDPPADWYDYTYSQWANIVTRNDGLESYYTWIPRYKYRLNSVTQTSSINFILGTDSNVSNGYKIPEAFWWDKNNNDKEDEGEQLTGYWISKYQLSREEVNKKFTAEISADNNSIHVRNINGTSINDNLNYEFYLNGDLKDTKGSLPELFTYSELTPNTTYTINIIARDKTTNAYVGAITRKLSTIDVNTPDLQSFISNTGLKDRTYYVVYNGDTIESYIPISENAPDNWYDYSLSKWANIVVTDGNVNENTITNATSTSYFVWVPRYKYKILSSLNDWSNASKDEARSYIEFISTDITNSNCGKSYKVPEAFWWDKNSNNAEDEGEQLSGYWISKYQLVNK